MRISIWVVSKHSHLLNPSKKGGDVINISCKDFKIFIANTTASSRWSKITTQLDAHLAIDTCTRHAYTMAANVLSGKTMIKHSMSGQTMVGHTMSGWPWSNRSRVIEPWQGTLWMVGPWPDTPWVAGPLPSIPWSDVLLLTIS